MKTLLAITTYNQIEYTKKLVNCLSKMNLENIDVIFIDDVSKDGTQKFIKESSFNIIERNQPKGLTWSWKKRLAGLYGHLIPASPARHNKY